jgi:hypothetical protein
MSRSQLTAVEQLLQLQQRRNLVSANVSDVIGTGTTKGRGGGIFELLNVDLIRRSVIVILHPKNGRTEKIIIIG